MAIKYVIKRRDKNNFDMEEAFREFYKEKQLLGIAQATLKGYQFTISKFITFFQSKNYQEINHIVLFDYIENLKLKTENIVSINHHLRIVRVFLYWCMQNKYNIKNFKISLLREQELPPKCHTNDELERLIAHPKKNDDFVTWRNWTVVCFMLSTGCRCGTVVGVKMSDIDFDNNQIIFRHTKNKKIQIVPLSISLKKNLKEYISIWRDVDDKESYLFPNIGEKPLNSHSLRNGYLRFCKRRNVINTSLHALRHDFARLWILNGGDVVRLQKILGHSSLNTTQRYVQLFGVDLQNNFSDFTALDNLQSKKQGTKHLVTRK